MTVPRGTHPVGPGEDALGIRGAELVTASLRGHELARAILGLIGIVVFVLGMAALFYGMG